MEKWNFYVLQTNKIERAAKAKMKVEGLTLDPVWTWLKEKVELPEYYNIFIENGFDSMKIISDIDKEDLKEIGINKRGHQNLILKCARNIF